jgi:hypothetical protein
MPLVPGVALSMNSAGVVSGTLGSMALARGQANALYTVAPALAAIDAAIAAPPPDGVAGNADAIDALEEQKQAVVDAWNVLWAPLILADTDAICQHLIDNANIRVTVPTIGGGSLQTSTAEGDPTDPPATDKYIFGVIYE